MFGKKENFLSEEYLKKLSALKKFKLFDLVIRKQEPHFGAIWYDLVDLEKENLTDRDYEFSLKFDDYVIRIIKGNPKNCIDDMYNFLDDHIKKWDPCYGKMG